MNLVSDPSTRNPDAFDAVGRVGVDVINCRPQEREDLFFLLVELEVDPLSEDVTIPGAEFPPLSFTPSQTEQPWEALVVHSRKNADHQCTSQGDALLIV